MQHLPLLFQNYLGEGPKLPLIALRPGPLLENSSVYRLALKGYTGTIFYILFLGFQSISNKRAQMKYKNHF